MGKRTFSVIKAEIEETKLKINKLKDKEWELTLELRKACLHQGLRFRSYTSESCSKCGKTLQTWPEHIGNPI